MIERKKALVAANIGMWVLQGLYTASPIDLIPDILPLLGWFDDLLGLFVTVAFTLYVLNVIRTQGLAGLLPARTSETAPATVLDVSVAPSGPEASAGYEPMSLDEIRAL